MCFLFSKHIGVAELKVLCLTFQETDKRFSEEPVPFYIPASGVCEFQLAISLPKPVIGCFDYSHPSGCEMVLHYVSFFFPHRVYLFVRVFFPP